LSREMHHKQVSQKSRFSHHLYTVINVYLSLCNKSKMLQRRTLIMYL